MPTVLVATEAFASAARSLASFKGYPNLPIVVLPHPFTTLPDSEVLTIAAARKDEILDRIVRPAVARVPA